MQDALDAALQGLPAGVEFGEHAAGDGRPVVQARGCRGA